ncbi:hypothetical protein [Kribbella steppae]|uniref:hypothetical protein n=1 Tax=Kribbella steppae TaxID=2512223 RepID=UPI0018EE8251|nr:hypothetical protein [Kribbella steppae]
MELHLFIGVEKRSLSGADGRPSPATRLESWTVLGDDGPVVPVERFLAYLTDIGRSPKHGEGLRT